MYYHMCKYYKMLTLILLLVSLEVMFMTLCVINFRNLKALHIKLLHNKPLKNI